MKLEVRQNVVKMCNGEVLIVDGSGLPDNLNDSEIRDFIYRNISKEEERSCSQIMLVFSRATLFHKCRMFYRNLKHNEGEEWSEEYSSLLHNGEMKKLLSGK